ncbi:MAG: DUF308 domain-containing protein [Bacilli bacterium]|nr:DUF308 domain-containing protein [Bacilli bacterium]
MKVDKLLSALFTIALGVLLCIFKQTMLQIIITIMGVLVVILGILDIARRKDYGMGIIKIIIGATAIIFAWLLTYLAFIVLGVILIVYGVFQLVNLLKDRLPRLPLLIGLINAIVIVIAGICCFFAETVAIMFLVVGIILIVYGVLSLIETIVK